uniref:hypothetical protein n=1 Tax=uncultured Allobacillus sp. TaxID=1638025 RepID=UPI0025946C10|nr:hypothetical protein [uncultured Allobacillus sp.]
MNINQLYNKYKQYDFNFLDELDLDHQQIETALKYSNVTVKGLPKDNFVEYRVKFPNFVAFFVHLIYTKRRMITQEEYINEYITYYEEYLNSVLFPNKIKFLRYRLSRAFSSLVRDLHFYHVLRDSNLFDEVSFNVALDCEEKIDVLVKKNNKFFGLQLHISTKRSNAEYLKKEKNVKRGVISNVKDVHYIDLPLSPFSKDVKRITSFKDEMVYYSNLHIQQVLDIINEDHSLAI